MSRDDVRWPAAAAFLCAALLGLLGLLAYGSGPINHLDTRIFERLADHRGGTAHDRAEALAPLADPLALLGFLGAAVGVALLRGVPSRALAAIAAVAGANITTQLLKFVLAHPRAQLLLGGSGEAGEIAFPSGHATAATSVAVAFAFVVPRSLLVPTLVLGGAFFALAVGCAVIVLAWHYPSDVLGGYLVAAGWGFAVLSALRAVEAPGEGPDPSDPSFSSRAPLPSR